MKGAANDAADAEQALMPQPQPQWSPLHGLPEVVLSPQF
jgi:hypothetical protein